MPRRLLGSSAGDRPLYVRGSSMDTAGLGTHRGTVAPDELESVPNF